jgi:hypothetical protein
LAEELERRPPRHPRRIIMDFPESLTRILAGMLAKHPANRYASAADIAVDLRDFCATPGIAATALKHCPLNDLWRT